MNAYQFVHEGSTYFCEASNHWGMTLGPAYRVSAPSISLDGLRPRTRRVDVGATDEAGLRLRCDTERVKARPQHDQPTWTKVKLETVGTI